MRCNYKVILSLILNLWRSDFTWDILLKYPSKLAEQSPTGCCVEQKKGPVFVKDFKMNDSYLEQPSAKLEKYANETFDMLKNFYNDKCQEQNFLIYTTNLEKVGKMNLIIDQ